MINLLSGAPGSGKTNYLIGLLLDEINSGRPLFVHGIPEFKLPHHKILCDSSTCQICIDHKKEGGHYVPADLFHEQVPDDALVILDECQHIFRPLRPGTPVPENIQSLETHRHKGIDFWFLTPSPKLIHINCREFVSRHIHMVAGTLSRVAYEWNECQTQTKENRFSAVKWPFKLNKKVYKLYRSSVGHYDQKRKIPKIVYALIPLAASIFVGFIFLIRSLTGSSGEPEASALADTTDVNPLIDTQSLVSRPIGGLSPAIPDFEPVDPFRLETAPAYQSLVEIKDFPRISACLATKDRCSCYTQQGTFYPTSLLQCLDFIDGRTFNPYLTSSQ